MTYLKQYVGQTYLNALPLSFDRENSVISVSNNSCVDLS